MIFFWVVCTGLLLGADAAPPPVVIDATGNRKEVIVVYDGRAWVVPLISLVPPNPEPGPDPDPDPDAWPLEKSKFSLDRHVWKTCKSMALSRIDAKKLAGCFTSIAAQAAAGAFASGVEIAEASRLANRTVLDDAKVAAWSPWFKSLQAELDKLWAAGKIQTVPDAAVAWREIGNGLSLWAGGK